MSVKFRQTLLNDFLKKMIYDGLNKVGEYDKSKFKLQ